MNETWTSSAGGDKCISRSFLNLEMYTQIGRKPQGGDIEKT